MRKRSRLGTRALTLLLVMVVTSSAASAERTHGVYLEILGKGGLWGLGYDHRLHRRVLLGVVASGYQLHDQRVLTLSPYLGVYLARNGPHSWFLDAGPVGVHTWTPSAIPEWSGSSSSGIGGEVSTGYEYRADLLVRVFGQGVFGKGGAFPWVGAGVGWTF